MRNLTLLLILALLLLRCLPAGSGGGSFDFASSAECGAIDPVNPDNPIPIRSDKHSKFYKGKLKSITSEQQFVAVIDHSCQSRSSNHISARILEKHQRIKLARTKGTSLRAYTWSPSKTLSVQQLTKLAESDTCLVSLEPDIRIQPFSTSTNDPFFNLLTFLPVIGALEAYDIFHHATTGATSEVVLAVIDSGIQLNHPDLTTQHWVNTAETAGNATDDDGNGYVDDVNGYNFASNIASPAAEGTASHGTHVSGLAAAKGDNSVGVTGVAGRSVKIMSLNVFGADENSASNANIINAIYYAGDMGAEVINMSLGGAGPSPAMKTALEYAVAQGSLIVVAAGNASEEVTVESTVPAGYGSQISGMITVGSQEVTTLGLSDFSNWSSSNVEIAAPGSDANYGGVYSTIPGSSYGYKQGTSMASPVVAGAAALALSLIKTRSQSATPAELEALMTGKAAIQTLLSGVVRGCAALDLESVARAIDAGNF